MADTQRPETFGEWMKENGHHRPDGESLGHHRAFCSDRCPCKTQAGANPDAGKAA